MAKGRRANGEGSWTKLENRGLWKLSKQYNKKRISFYGKTKEAALEKSKQYELSLQNGVAEDKIKTPTVKEYSDWWLWNVKIHEVKRAPFDRVECNFRIHIVDEIGHIPYDQITTEIIQTQVINKMINGKSERTGKAYSYSSIKQVKDALGSMYRYAYANNKIPHNPVPKVVISKWSTPKPKQIKYFTAEERTSFIRVARSKYKSGKWRYWYGEFLIFLLYTGMRCGEGEALRWKNIDLDARTVTIDSTVIKTVNRDEFSDDPAILLSIQESTKTNLNRTIYLSDAAYEAALAIKGNRNPSPEDMFMTTQTGHLINSAGLRSCFIRIVKQAGIEQCNVHSLRHSCASMLYANGISLDVISMLLGHSSVAITQKIYAEMIDADKVKRMHVIKEII